jgi:hypothetical protein
LIAILLGMLPLQLARAAAATDLTWKGHMWKMTLGGLAGVCQGDPNNVSSDAEVTGADAGGAGASGTAVGGGHGGAATSSSGGCFVAGPGANARGALVMLALVALARRRGRVNEPRLSRVQVDGELDRLAPWSLTLIKRVYERCADRRFRPSPFARFRVMSSLPPRASTSIACNRSRGGVYEGGRRLAA